jgi:hypothetical protein
LVQILVAQANHPRHQENFAIMAGNIAAAGALKMAESRQRLTLCPLLLTLGAVLAGK